MAIEEKDINIYLAVPVQTVIDLFFKERNREKNINWLHFLCAPKRPNPQTRYVPRPRYVP